MLDGAPGWRENYECRLQNEEAAGVPRRRPSGRYLPKPSNSPFLTPPIKACHSSGVNLRTGPAEFLLLRTATSPPGRPATSTQLPLA
jgi:hypothetical protein